MGKGEEHAHNDKKKAQHSLKEKRLLKQEKRANKNRSSTVSPDMLGQ